MTPLGYMFAKILDNACPSYQATGANGDIGFWMYRVETHCVNWDIMARKTDGVWEIKNYWLSPISS